MTKKDGGGSGGGGKSEVTTTHSDVIPGAADKGSLMGSDAIAGQSASQSPRTTQKVARRTSRAQGRVRRARQAGDLCIARQGALQGSGERGLGCAERVYGSAQRHRLQQRWQQGVQAD